MNFPKTGARRIKWAVVAVLLVAPAVFGQWTNQTLSLHAGWNAVFLDLQPEPRDCDTLFAGLPVESVWGWNRHFSSVQYIQDPNSLIPGQPNWLTYLPPGSTNRAVNSLFTLQGDHAYLIKLAANAPTISWAIQGRPSMRGVEWVADSFNLVGFHIDPNSPPTFQSFFAYSPAQVGHPIQRLSASGAWAQVSPGSDTMKRGEAYWIYCVGQSTYNGPLTVAAEQARSLDYGRRLTEQTLTIQNNSTNTLTVTITPLPSTAPVSINYPAVAGPVPLSYWRGLYPSSVGFVPLTAPLAKSISPGTQLGVRLAIRRVDMTPSAPPPGALYQSLLQIRDGAGTSWLVPVTANGLQSSSTVAGGISSLAVTNSDPRAGLWVGSAVINKVNQPASVVDGVTPFSTSSDFQFRIIVHVDNSGQARLLQKVLMMWKNGTYATNAAGYQVVDQPGNYVLLTRDDLIPNPNYSGAAMRDGQLLGRRISSVAFGFRDPIDMTGSGSFGADGSIFSCASVLDYRDVLNPFVHRYHPDHNNLDEDFTTPLGEGIESYTVARQIQLQFRASDPDNLSSKVAGWGDNQLGGIYKEAINGLHKSTIYAEGTFRVRRACSVGVLNGGQ